MFCRIYEPFTVRKIYRRKYSTIAVTCDIKRAGSNLFEFFYIIEKSRVSVPDYLRISIIFQNRFNPALKPKIFVLKKILLLTRHNKAKSDLKSGIQTQEYRL